MKFWMGRYAALAITGLLTVTLVGCSAGTDTAGQADGAAQACELNVFAAASMQETLEQIADQYEAENPGVAVLLNLDSSGTLKTQIEQGADCDVFISAAQKQMDELDIAVDADKNPDGWILLMTLPGWISWKTRLCSWCLRATPKISSHFPTLPAGRN